MTSDTVDAQEDLTLNDKDADEVGGGRMWRETAMKTQRKQGSHLTGASASAPLQHFAGGPGDPSLKS